MSLEIRCACGAVRGRADSASGSNAGRFICYCDDCQAFAKYLSSSRSTLDANGGTEITPFYPDRIQITQGADQLRCLRLSSKGLFRWYAGCCRTPIANSNPGLPWAGIIHTALVGEREKELGPVRGGLFGKFAIGIPPNGTPEKFSFREFLMIVPFMAKGFIFGRKRPSPFYDSKTGAPASAPQVLSKEERFHKP